MTKKKTDTKAKKQQAKLKKWEGMAENLHEHLHNLLDELEGHKSEMQSAKYQTLRHRLTQLHGQSDRIDALLMERAISTDDWDEPFTEITF